MSSEELNNFYTPEFYAGQCNESFLSAKIILGQLFEIYKPNSVVDFGCGVGSWLAAAESLGSKILKGYDGNWVQQENLISRTIDFTPTNMEQDIEVLDKYDLAMSLEVAEHLTEQRAKSFVDTLCKASDVVLFGAAIKNQCGENHINEQQQSYWVKLFQMYDYECFDIFRSSLWNDKNVNWWYRQNTFLFLNSKSALIHRESLRAMEKTIYDIVHPENIEEKMQSFRQTYRKLQEGINEPTLRFFLGVARRYLLGKIGIKVV